MEARLTAILGFLDETARTQSPMLLLLIGLHFVCDYTLQSPAMAVGKIPHAIVPNGVPWFYWMTAHAATHAVAVGLVTRSATLGLFEFAAHSGIDVLKCRRYTNIHHDQILHILCKIAWIVILSGKWTHSTL